MQGEVMFLVLQKSIIDSCFQWIFCAMTKDFESLSRVVLLKIENLDLNFQNWSLEIVM